jgi:hypothetical protein
MRNDSATAVKTAVIRTRRPRGRDAHAEAWQAVVWRLIVSHSVRGRGQGARSERAPRSLERVFAGWMDVRPLIWLL